MHQPYLKWAIFHGNPKGNNLHGAAERFSLNLAPLCQPAGLRWSVINKQMNNKPDPATAVHRETQVVIQFI